MRYRFGCTYGYAEGDYRTDVLYFGCACGNFFWQCLFRLRWQLLSALVQRWAFFVTTPLIIAARAATHIIFALVGALIIKRYPNIMESFVAGIGLNLGLAVLHALGEVIVVAPFFFSGYMFTPEQLSNGFVMSVIVLVGAGTVLHSVMDCSISVLLWKFVRVAVPSIKLIRG